MFVDADAPLEITDPLLVTIANVLGDPSTIVRIRQGVYMTPLNHHLAQGLAFEDKYPEFPNGSDLEPYGVADSVNQFLDRFSDEIEADPRPLFVTFTKIARETQSPTGGWRWHKWGTYLGEKDPQEEYLYDEPDIESVVVFHLFCKPNHPSLEDLRYAVSQVRGVGPADDGLASLAARVRAQETDEQSQ